MVASQIISEDCYLTIWTTTKCFTRKASFQFYTKKLKPNTEATCSVRAEVRISVLLANCSSPNQNKYNTSDLSTCSFTSKNKLVFLVGFDFRRKEKEMNSKERNSRFMTFVCAVAILVLFYKTIIFVVIGFKAALWTDWEEKSCQ